VPVSHLDSWRLLALSHICTVPLHPFRFTYYLTNGHPENLQRMQSSGIGSRLMPSDELLKNNSERELAKLFEKEIDYYRSI
jgi:hypothetical protein